VERKTIFSECGEYRYCLWREWDKSNPEYALFILLNPSTADETNDDRTIRRCIDYAKQWGYGALCVVNLLAYRATKPAAMKKHRSPVGRDNDEWLKDMAKDAKVIVAAWGTHGTHLKRDTVVKDLFAGKLSCIKLSKSGHPRHPLFLPRTLQPIPFDRG
jgi:hypothetical protein